MILAADGTASAATVATALLAGDPADAAGAGHFPALALAVAASVAVAAGMARELWTARLGDRLAEDTVRAMLDRLPRLPATWFARRSVDQVATAPLAGLALQGRIDAVIALCALPALALPAAAALALDPLAGAGQVMTAGLDLALLAIKPSKTSMTNA